MASAYEEALKNCQEAHAARDEYIKTHPESRSQTSIIKSAVAQALGGYSGSHAGVAVTPESAMRTAAAWACIRVLSTALGALPVHVYRESGGTREKATDYPVYNILHREPNPEITAFTYRSIQMANLCQRGNSYAEIEFDGFGIPRALWPIPAWCCEPQRTQSKELFYRITMPDTGEIRDLQPYRMLHILGLGTDGIKGLSPIRQMAETLGISIAAEQFGARFFGQGTNIGGVVEHPGKLSTPGSDNLRKSLNEKYAGLGNTFRIMLLEEGMKYQKAGIPPNEAQFLETRQFQVEDVARIFGVQLHKIGHLLHATFSNIEHQAIEFVTDTILPWAVNIEMENDRKLLKPGLYSKHALEGLLRGDSVSRAAFYRELSYLGAICADEIREKEEMNPIPGGYGKRFFVQANMVPVDKVDEYIKKPNGGSAASPSRNITDAVKRIAERDKQNLTRALSKYEGKPEEMKVWLGDYLRDFPEFMIKQLSEPDK